MPLIQSLLTAPPKLAHALARPGFILDSGALSGLLKLLLLEPGEDSRRHVFPAMIDRQ